VRAVDDACRGMTMRLRRETFTFQNPFQIRGIDRLLSPGAYEVMTGVAEFGDGDDFHRLGQSVRSQCLDASAPHE
jgi:hypothetical protein